MGSIPSTPDRITATWLTDELRRSGALASAAKALEAWLGYRNDLAPTGVLAQEQQQWRDMVGVAFAMSSVVVHGRHG